MANLREVVERVDKHTESPTARAQRVWNLVKSQNPELTDWDILCFAVEYIGSMVANWAWLEDVAKPLAKRLYVAHYSMMDKPPEPEKKEEISGSEGSRIIVPENTSRISFKASLRCPICGGVFENSICTRCGARR